MYALEQLWSCKIRFCSCDEGRLWYDLQPCWTAASVCSARCWTALRWVAATRRRQQRKPGDGYHGTYLASGLRRCQRCAYSGLHVALMM
jgi:hypothetical protein